MKDNKTTVNEPMDLFAASEQKAGVRKLDLTPSLVAKADSHAQLIIRESIKNTDLKTLIEKSFTDAASQDLLIDKFVDAETIKIDAELLAAADADQLDKLLKSQQSKRTRSKAPVGEMVATEYLKCISSAYAERLIRIAMNKPKNAKNTTGPLSAEEVEALANDQAALGRKIRSLQSKTCLLRQRADFETATQQAIYNGTLQEIARLQGLRPEGTSGKTVVKESAQLSNARKMFATLDLGSMSEDEQKSALATLASMLA